MIEVHYLTFNPFGENTYIIFNENKQAMLVDAGNFFKEETEQLFNFITQHQLIIEHIVNTHCHIDHVFGLQAACEKYNKKLLMHKNEEVMLNYAPQSAARFGIEFNSVNVEKEFIKEGDIIKLGEDEFEIFETFGHSPGHIALYNKKQNFVISGDVLFYESIGRTDLPMCNHEELISSIKNKLFVLPNETTVYCGHGNATTIGYEKENNPFVK